MLIDRGSAIGTASDAAERPTPMDIRPVSAGEIESLLAALVEMLRDTVNDGFSMGPLRNFRAVDGGATTLAVVQLQLLP